MIRVLCVPARTIHACAVLVLPDHSVDFSNAIGGGCLEEVPVDLHGQGCCVYLNADRCALPVNTRLTSLVQALGSNALAEGNLRGDALLSGLMPTGEDTDVPEAVLRTARCVGFLTHPIGRTGTPGPAGAWDLPSP